MGTPGFRGHSASHKWSSDEGRVSSGASAKKEADAESAKAYILHPFYVGAKAPTPKNHS